MAVNAARWPPLMLQLLWAVGMLTRLVLSRKVAVVVLLT
jgi:hypothetical protein